MSTSRMGRVRAVLLVAGVNLMIAVAASALAAQMSPNVKLHVFAGTMDAQGELQDAPILATSPNVLSYGALPARAAFGLGVELSPGDFPVSLRLGVARSLTDQRTGEWRCSPSSEPVACPAILIEVPTDMSATVSSADFIGAIPLARAALHPLVGVSWVRHHYEWDPGAADSFSLAPGESTRNAAALHVGLGLSAPIGSTRVLAEYAQLYSKADLARPSRMGTATIGVVIPVM